MTAGTIDLEHGGFAYKLDYAQREQDENGGTFRLARVNVRGAHKPVQFGGTLHDLMQLSNEHRTHSSSHFITTGLKMKSCWDPDTKTFCLENEFQFIRVPLELLELFRTRFTS